MGRRSKAKFKVFESVRLESAVAEGNCIARVDGQAMFVKFGAPGDLVDVQVFQKKKNYMEGRILRFHEKSPLRTNPMCKHFTVCGGCKWQHLPYSEQLKFKQQQVVDSLERIGKVKDFEVLPIVGSTQEYGYRNKLDLSFSDRAWLVDVPKMEWSAPKLLDFMFRDDSTVFWMWNTVI